MQKKKRPDWPFKLHLKARSPTRGRSPKVRNSPLSLSFSLSRYHETRVRERGGKKERGTDVFPAVGGQRRNNESPSSGASTTGCFKTNGFWPPAVTSLSPFLSALRTSPRRLSLARASPGPLPPAGRAYATRARWAIAIGPP